MISPHFLSFFPQGRATRGGFFSFAFQQSFNPSHFNLECFLFPFPLFIFLQRKKAKRQQRGDEGEPLKTPKSSPTSKKCHKKPPSIPEHPRLMKEKVSAKLPELNPLLENTHENSFLFYSFAGHPSVAAILQRDVSLSHAPEIPTFPGRQQAVFGGRRAPACRRAHWHGVLAAKPAGHGAGELLLLGQLPGFWLPSCPGRRSCSPRWQPGSAGSLWARCCVGLRCSNNHN